MKFKTEILDNKKIRLGIMQHIVERDEKGIWKGKDVDYFEFDNKDIIELQRVLTRAMFAWCKKFKCTFDDPVCK
jgi:hypothetical protein